MKASEAINNYLRQVKTNVENQVGDDDKDIVYTDIDFVRWLIDELNGDLNVDINIYQLFDVFISQLE